MKCKICGNVIDDDANFCSYCGNAIQQDNNEREYDDPFKELRLEMTDDGQYQYRNDFSDNKQGNNYDNSTRIKKETNRILVIFILCAFSTFTCFIKMFSFLGIVLSIVSFIYALSSIKRISIISAIFSILISIITFIVALIINIMLFLSSMEMTLSNGDKINVKQYFIDAFFCGYYEKVLEGNWINSSNGLLYLDLDGNYYIYEDANNLDDNYYYGNFKIEEGNKIDDITLYADENYYIYNINTSENESKILGNISDYTIDLIENGFKLKLDKKNRDNLVLVSSDDKTEFLFKKQ